MRCLRGVASVAVFCLGGFASVWAIAADELRVATFQSDITPPLGQPMISGDALRTVEQPLLAKGIVLEAGAERYVLCALDWCELCNGAHDRMQKQIAAAAGTKPAHVALQCVHQHTAPLVDLDAQKLLAKAGVSGLQLDPPVFDAIERKLVAAVKGSLKHFEPFDQIGTGQAKVEHVAATRRPLDASGKIWVRYSSCKSAALRALPEGAIDPYLKTITLAEGQKPLVRIHYYATHPQTFYGDHRASSDLPGDVREALQRKEGVFQIYFTGCGGDVTMGKYNDGSKEARRELAARLLPGMEAAVAATKLASAGSVQWRTYPLVLPPRTDRGFTMAESLARLNDPKAGPARLYYGASNVAFIRRSQQPIVLSSLEIGGVHIVHLPGEPMVCFQRFAQSLKPGAFVAVAGYGDGGTGYLCPAKAYGEGGYEPTASRVKPESETLVKKAIAALLGAE
jgi:hypothetical protein